MQGVSEIKFYYIFSVLDGWQLCPSPAFLPISSWTLFTRRSVLFVDSGCSKQSRVDTLTAVDTRNRRVHSSSSLQLEISLSRFIAAAPRPGHTNRVHRS